MSKKICFITTAHPPFDTRIFYREAITLSHSGYEVYLIASHNKRELIDGIKIIPLSLRKKRFYRISIKSWEALLKGLKINANVYHFHDPELMLIGIILKLFGKKVIYDVHENVSLQIYSKDWISQILRKPIGAVSIIMEWLSLLFFDKIIIAGEDIGLQPHFQKFSYKIMLLRNFPVISLSEKDVFPKPQDKINFIYTGGLSKDRGILEIIQAFKKVKSTNIKLFLLGHFNSFDFKRKIINEINGDNNIEYIPSLSYKEMFAMLAKCHVGLICFKPIPNNIGALSGRNNKIYEYLGAGLSIIGSNFPFWKNFIDGNKIGITIDPTNITKIKEAMEFFILNPEKIEVMGYNAKKLSAKYSWEKESTKLINLYNNLLELD